MGTLTLQPIGLAPERAVTAQYDPEHVEESREVTWRTTCIPGLVSGLVTYSTAEHRLRFSLLFDAHHSPKRDIAEDLNKLLDLTIPRDVNGRRVQQQVTGFGPNGEFGFVQGAELSGVPPKVLLTYGGRTLVVRVSRLAFDELMFGTTPETKDRGYPTRVIVDIEFIVSDDERNFIDVSKMWSGAQQQAESLPGPPSPILPFGGLPSIRELLGEEGEGAR